MEVSARDELTMHYGSEGDGLWRPLMDKYRAEVLNGVADRADPVAPEVSWFGDYGPQVAAWLRRMAEEAP